MKLYCVTTEIYDNVYTNNEYSYKHNMKFCTDKQIAEKILKMNVCKTFNINNDYELFMYDDKEYVNSIVHKSSGIKYYLNEHYPTFHTVDCIHECVCSKYKHQHKLSDWKKGENMTYDFSIKEHDLEKTDKDGVSFSIKIPFIY